MACRVVTRHNCLNSNRIEKTFVFKPYEFWNPRIFEFPYYLYLTWCCLRRGIGIKTLAKANWALDHGEIGLSSKFDTQMTFDQGFFLPTILLKEELAIDDKRKKIIAFAEEHGYPLILKSNLGSVGKGIVKLNSEGEIDRNVDRLLGDFLLQKFTPFSKEVGIFYVRTAKGQKISGINEKHFPTVVGNGKDTIAELAKNHYRYTHHWNSFLQDIDTSEVIADGESRRISFIGSHTLGCKFTDDTHLLTPELEQAVFSLFETQAGYNFGRIDVKAESHAALQRGEFVVIEVNGIASLPTNMFDPKFSIWQAYRIFFEHARYLADAAASNKHQSMQLMSIKELLERVKENHATLEAVHHRLMSDD